MRRILINDRSRQLLAASLAMALFGTSGAASAGTATDDLSVTATVSSNCSISTTAVGFGAYDPAVAHASTDLDGTGAVSVTCTDGASVTITLAQGSNAGTGTDADPVRRMIAGNNYLSYELFMDSGRTKEWGNTAATGLAVTGTGAVVSSTVYGRVPSGQNVPAGSYSDTVVATVTF